MKACLHIHIHHVQYEGYHSFHFSCPLFSRLLSAWGAAATPVIPIRQGTHSEGADPQTCKQTLTSSYTKMNHRTYTDAHTHTHAPTHVQKSRKGGRGGLLIKEG